jgi:hypothetical protein
MKGNMEGYFMDFAKQMRNGIEQSEERVSKLSEEMLAGRDRYQPIPDGEFQALMNLLREKVRGLSRDLSTAAKAVKMPEKEYRKILEGKILTTKVDDDGWGDSKKVFLIQSAVWRILHDHIFDDPFQVFGREGPEVTKTWKLLFPEGWPLLLNELQSRDILTI